MNCNVKVDFSVWQTVNKADDLTICVFSDGLDSCLARGSVRSVNLPKYCATVGWQCLDRPYRMANCMAGSETQTS